MSSPGGPSVWTIASVKDEPETTLTNWQVLELPNGDRHLVGYAVEDREGRVSSRVQVFDNKSLCGVTSSGRVYRLKGRPGIDKDAECVWRTWARINQASQFSDVSSAVWAARASGEPHGLLVDNDDAV